MGNMEAIMAAILGKAVDKRDPALSNVGVKARLDALGAILVEFQAAWNANITAAKLVVPALGEKYPATFTEV